MTIAAFSAWGDYDRDDPFPLFEQVRAPVRCTGSRSPMDTRRG